MSTHERRIRIAWVETDAPPAVVADAPVETPLLDETDLEASRERIWSIFAWVCACSTFAAVQGCILPVFAKMFREVGMRVPLLTEAVIGTPGMVYGLGVLSLFHAAAMTRSAETREHLRVVAFFAVILAIGLTLYGLFLPMTMSQKL